MPPPLILLLLLPFLFVAVWFLSMHLIAAVGGWRDLARAYASEAPIAATMAWHNRFGRLRAATGYNGCLNVAVNSMGMQLSLWPIFRLAHPPLFIPWNDIHTEPVHGFFADYVRFSFRNARTAPLLLRRDFAEEVLRVRSPAWHTSPPPSSFSAP